MTIKEQFFFQAMEGNWVTKRTIYAPKDKILFHYQENINYNNNNIIDLNNEKSYSFIILDNQKKFNKFNISKRINKKYLNTYNCTTSQNTLMKVTIFKYGMNYIEYIYHISKNLKISIAILKYTKNYIAIIFTSYIKKIT